MNDEQLNKVIHICYKWYDNDTFLHCVRVLAYLNQDILFKFIPQENQNDLKALALCHDLLEDTNILLSDDFSILIDLGISFDKLQILTRNKNQSYDEYIKLCLNDSSTRIVKCADMCDHLSHEDTLTERLKNKYDKVAYLFFDNLNNWN